MTVTAPQQLADMPPQARACWAPSADEDDEALSFILNLIARQPLACGVLMGRTTPVAEMQE